MTSATLRLTIAALFAAWLGTVAVATPIYGVDDLTDTLVRIDPTTGVVSGGFGLPTAPNVIAGLSGAEGGRVLIYTDQGFSGNPLFRIDPWTGAVLSSHALPVTNRGGLSYETVAAGPDSIIVINDGLPVRSQLGYGGPDAALLNVSPNIPGAMGGDDRGRHFVWTGTAAAADQIVEFHPITGAILNAFGNPTGTSLAGLAFDGTTLYASEFGQSTRLFRIDPDTGALLSTVTLSRTVSLAGLATVIPEPGTIVLLGLGLAAAGLVARRRTRR